MAAHGGGGHSNLPLYLKIGTPAFFFGCWFMRFGPPYVTEVFLSLFNYIGEHFIAALLIMLIVIALYIAKKLSGGH